MTDTEWLLLVYLFFFTARDLDWIESKRDKTCYLIVCAFVFWLMNTRKVTNGDHWKITWIYQKTHIAEVYFLVRQQGSSVSWVTGKLLLKNCITIMIVQRQKIAFFSEVVGFMMELYGVNSFREEKCISSCAFLCKNESFIVTFW